MLARQPKSNSWQAVSAVLVGMACGVLIELPALFAAIISGGAGHGHYVAARLLFPFPMLLTLFEGSIGVLSQSTALLQFPLYGALLGWSIWRKSYGAVILIASLHLVAVVSCFSGILPNFS